MEIKDYEAISTNFFTLVEICLRLNDEIMCPTALFNLNAKKSRVYVQEGGQKVEATGSTRFHKTWWNKIGSHRTSQYIDGLIHSVFVKNPTLSQFTDSDARIQTTFYYLADVYRPNTPVGSIRYLITLRSTPCSFTLLNGTPTKSHC